MRVDQSHVGSVKHLEATLEAFVRLGLRPAVDGRVFSFEQAADAYRYLKSGAHFGKIVIRG